jgi:hypothetical protein
VTAKAPVRHCAVYTRKSSEEGLEQNFNSLHAQREACEAFIRSQRGEGWRLIETAYDDGGLSGGTLERPALQRLFADIAQHRVDTVVVYKVDRLTRSLMDFAKIVELFVIELSPLRLRVILSAAALGSVEIWDSPTLDIVIQAWDGPICAERRPVGENATALPGEEVGPWPQR